VGGRAELGGERLAPLVQHVADDDARAGGHQGPCEGLAQAARGTGDQHAPAVQADFGRIRHGAHPWERWALGR
jgi:hypothetical protein